MYEMEKGQRLDDDDEREREREQETSWEKSKYILIEDEW